MTRHWTKTLPFPALAAKCLDAISGRAPADDYLVELVDLAWQGAVDVLGPDRQAELRLSVAGDGTAETALVSVGGDGLVTVNLVRIRALALHSLDLAEHVTRNFVGRFLFGMANLPELVELDGFEERALPNPDSPWYDPDSGSLIYDLMRSAGAVVWQEPGQPSDALPRFDLGLLSTGIRDGEYDLLFDPLNGPYVIRLHHHIFVNALMFALLHESAHLSQGHFDADDHGPVTQRLWEIDADAEALARLSGDPGGDPRAAISILRYTHVAEPEPSGARLSHPHSAERLALLAEAIRATGDTALAEDINETLRELVRPGGQVLDDQGNTARLLISSDLDAAYVEARVEETIADGVTMAAWDRLPRLPLRAQVRLHDPVDPGSVLAEATVHVYFGNKIHMMYDDETGLLTHILRARFPTPPTWRLQWPNARLAITSIIAVPEALDPVDQAAMQTMIDTKRRIVWNLPDEELLGLEILASGEEVNADARSFLEWARWCDEYAAPEAAIFLRAVVAEQIPEQLPAHLLGDVLKGLLAVNDLARAHRVALAYVERTGRVLPGVQYVYALRAIEDSDRLAAFDHLFAETHGFGPDVGFGPTAGELLIQLLADREDDPDLAQLLAYFQHHGQYQSARFRRRAHLTRAREILDNRLTPRALGLLSIRQLRAETHAAAWRLGERGADTAAARIFEQLIADHPWFVAAAAQLARLRLDQGDREAALRHVRQAERTAPAHPQVMDVRERLMQAGL